MSAPMSSGPPTLNPDAVFRYNIQPPNSLNVAIGSPTVCTSMAKYDRDQAELIRLNELAKNYKLRNVILMVVVVGLVAYIIYTKFIKKRS